MISMHINNPAHYADFVSLNEQWITEYFQLEESDRKLAANPGAVIDNGGYILSLSQDDDVIGVCALFKQAEDIYELARLAVEKNCRRQGHADRLVSEALAILHSIGARQVTLMSNTILANALALYRKHGFVTQSEGPHPIYKRTNIVMTKDLRVSTNV